MSKWLNIKIFLSSPQYLKILGALLLFAFILLPSFSWAQDGYNVNNGYACPGMNILKERYQGDCFPCEIVKVLLASFMRAASKVYDVSKEAGNKLLLIGSAIWLAFWALKQVSALTPVEPANITKELINFFGKVLVAYCFINAGIGTLVSYAINPILGAGAEFGSALLLETEGIDISSTPETENQYTGPTDIVSKSVMDKILKLSEGVSNEVATNFVIGSGLTCFSIQNGLHIYVPALIDIHIPDIWLWLCGAAIWFVGFMLVLSVCYYLIDIPFKIGFAIIALPVVIGLWPFKVTAGKLKSVVGIALNAAFTFLFLALSSSYAIRLISQAFSAEGDLDIGGQTYSGKEALFKAFEVDNEEFVQSLFDFTGPAFLIILFCYIYAIKMISEITNNYPGKFDTGMTSAAGSPLHHMATAATMWATGKVTAPFKTGIDIIAHQAGKAATTVTKAAANVGISSAGAVVGIHNKFLGKAINKATSGWVKKQQNLKAVADSLDQFNSSHPESGMGAKIQGKLGKFGASVGLGLANTVNRFGQSLENSSDILMNPGKNTLNRVVSAAKSSGLEIKDAGKELGGALKETIASLTPQQLAEKLQQSKNFSKIGNSVLQTKANMREQSHQDFNKSVQNLGKVTNTFTQSLSNAKNVTQNNLTTAFAAMGNGISKIRSGEVSERLASMSKSGVKYVVTGKFLKDAYLAGKESVSKMNARTAQDIQHSKENIIHLKDVGQNFKQNIHMAQADLGEAGHSLMHGNMTRNWNALKEDISTFKDNVSKDTGIQNKYGAAFATLTGISLGIATARHLGRSLKEGGDYVTDAKADDLMSAVGKGVVRPSVALGMTLVDTTRNTVKTAYNLTEGTLLTGIGVAQTVLAPVGNLTRATMNLGASIGDTGLAFASAGGGLAGMAVTRLNVAYQYTKYATRPVTALVGLPFRGAGKALGFAAKTVDNTLYGGYRTVASVGKGVAQGGNILGQGANVLYHGVKDRTVVGQVVTKTLKSGSKTLSLAAKTLKLGRNVIKAAAGEDFDGMDNRKSSKQAFNNKYQDKQDLKRREKEKEEKARKEQQRQEQEQREREREEQERKEQEQREREREEQERKEQEQREREREEQERKEQEQREREKEEQEENNKNDLLNNIEYTDSITANNDRDFYLVRLASKATQIKNADYKFRNEVSERFAELPPKVLEDKIYGYYDLIDKGEIGLHEALRVKQFAQDYLAQNMDKDQYNELIQETDRIISQNRKNLTLGVVFDKDGKEVLISKDHDIVDNYTPSEFAKQQGIDNLVGMDVQITGKDQVSRFKLTDDMGGCELTISSKDSNDIKDTTIYSYHDGNYYKSVGYSHEEIVPQGSSEYDLVKSEIENAQHEAIDVFSEFKIGMHDKAIVDSIWGSQGVKEKQKNNRVLDQMKKENQEKYNQMQKKHQETIDRIRNGENVDVFNEYQEDVDKKDN